MIILAIICAIIAEIFLMIAKSIVSKNGNVGMVYTVVSGIITGVGLWCLMKGGE